VGFSRASGAALELVLFFLGFGEEHDHVFLVKVLGLSPGAAPLLFLAGALHTLPGPGIPDDLRAGPTISLRTLCGEPLCFHIVMYILNLLLGFIFCLV